MSKLLKPPRGAKIPDYWSLSAYNNWRECAYKYMLKKVLRLPDPPGPAMERGIRIHSLFEGILLGNVTGMPDELKKMRKEIMNLKKLEAEPEADWTLKKDLTRTHAKDWSGAWLRAKIDAHVYFDDGVLLIIDLKTGKVKPYIAQKEVYAWIGTLIYPDVKAIETEWWFSDHDYVESGKYSVDEAKKLGTKWKKRAKAMLEDRTFKPNPGDACRYCPYKSSKKMETGEMGPCHEWKKVV